MLFTKPRGAHDHYDHDDHGGLHRDLAETSVAMDRCGMLRLAARFGVYTRSDSGRWPHIHFEVYQSLTAATAVKNKIATSQIALPLASNDLPYATSNYSSSARNQAQITLASDNVLGDGASLELGAVTGDVTNGTTAALTVPV